MKGGRRGEGRGVEGRDDGGRSRNIRVRGEIIKRGIGESDEMMETGC